MKLIVIVFITLLFSCINHTEFPLTDLQIANSDLEEGVWPDAISKYTELISSPDFKLKQNAYEGRGFAHLMSSSYTLAQSDFQEALDIDDEKIDSKVGLALTNYLLGEFSDATELIEEVLNIENNYSYQYISGIEAKDLHLINALSLFNKKKFANVHTVLTTQLHQPLNYQNNDPAILTKLLESLSSLSKSL